MSIPPALPLSPQSSIPRHISPPPDSSSYFHATSWIYSTEKQALQRPPSPLFPVTLPNHSGNTSSTQISITGKVRKRYLICKDRSDPGYRKKLMEAIRKDPSSFYYYKQRRLSKPPEYQGKTKIQLPSLPEKSPKSPHIPPPHPCAVATPDFKRPPKPAITQSLALSLSPHRKPPVSSQELEPEFLRTIIQKCDNVRPTKEILSFAERERSQRRQLERRLDWTKETLDLVEDCEADVLIPFYTHQKEAMEEIQRDVHRMIAVHRRSDCHQTSLHLHRILKRNKNQLL